MPNSDQENTAENQMMIVPLVGCFLPLVLLAVLVVCLIIHFKV